jgi:hypothetical protein
MASCWTCRTNVQMVIQVWGLVSDDVCPVCFETPDELCVAVPCGHHICSDCSREWQLHQRVLVSVPGALQPVQPASVPPPVTPVLAPAVDPLLPAPWLLPEAGPPPGVTFAFAGMVVRWVHLERYGCVCLVNAYTGALCKAGNHDCQPTAPDGFAVWWHRASRSANQKWCLSAVVHEV